MWKWKNNDYTIALLCCYVLNALHHVNTEQVNESVNTLFADDQNPLDGQGFGNMLVAQDQNLFEDWSNKCKRGEIFYNFLTVGMGRSDVLTVVVSRMLKVPPNCTIIIKICKESLAHTIVTIEFPDLKSNKKNVNSKETRIIITTGNGSAIDAVERANAATDGETYASVVARSHEVNISVSGNKHFETTKITATAARKADKDGTCDDKLEVKCERSDDNIYSTYCMTRTVACDAYLNCGFLKRFDEDILLCDNTQPVGKYLLVIFIVIAMIAIALFFFIRLLRSKIPRVGNNFFVFNEDEDNRLNLGTVFANAAPESKPCSITSHSSSYHFKSATIPEIPEEQQLNESRRTPRKDSEIELPLYVFGQTRSRTVVRPNTVEPMNKEQRPTTSQEYKDRKQARFNDENLEMDISPDFTLNEIRELRDTPRRSILGHSHDEKLFPVASRHQGPDDANMLQIEKKRRKQSLTQVRSSKDLMFKKFRGRDQDDDDGPKPHRRPKPDTDSD